MSTKINFTQLLTVSFIFFLTILPSKSVGFDGQGLHEDDENRSSRNGNEEEMIKTSKKMVLGSRPPRCVNKCLNCRPCTATLVVPSHQKKSFDHRRTFSNGDEDDSYYLLSWKCTCGNKLFHP